ncbi:MAG: hypothetical protein WBC83_00225 [Minisyncoccia bacterium]
MFSEVKFDFEEEQSQSIKPKESALVRLVIKYSGGFIKDKKQANYVLLGFAVLAIIISLLLFSGVNIKKGPNIPPSVPTSFTTSAL